METKILWGVIAISVIVGIVTAIATVSLTGDVVKVGNKLVYTKAEVDSKLNGLTTNKGVLEMLSQKCFMDRSGYNTASCDTICQQNDGQKCIFGMAHVGYTEGSNKLLWDFPVTCSEIPEDLTDGMDGVIDIDTSCLCCSA